MQPELAVITLPVAALVPYAENARTHSPAQVAQIASSIAEFGFVNPVLVDGAGVLVAGHGRVMAAKRLGMASVPAIRLAHLTDAQARALVFLCSCVCAHVRPCMRYKMPASRLALDDRDKAVQQGSWQGPARY